MLHCGLRCPVWMRFQNQQTVTLLSVLGTPCLLGAEQLS